MKDKNTISALKLWGVKKDITKLIMIFDYHHIKVRDDAEKKEKVTFHIHNSICIFA